MLSALALLLVQKSKESSERKMERESGIIELCMREKYFMVENLFSLGEVCSQAWRICSWKLTQQNFEPKISRHKMDINKKK